MIATATFLGPATPIIMYLIGVVIGVFDGVAWASLYWRHKR